MTAPRLTPTQRLNLLLLDKTLVRKARATYTQRIQKIGPMTPRQLRDLRRTR